MTAPLPTSENARVALLAGTSGLVGRALLPLLLGSPRYARVHALLRREVAGLPASARLQTHIVDFARLPPLPAIDDVFIALGTTIKVARSQEAFRRVDFDAVVDTARAARAAGATRLLLVSALGANAASGVFYNRVKGEAERAVAQLGYEAVVIAQPSLLSGDRAALGQPVRSGEVWGERLLRWLPSTVRPIAASDVARALVRAAAEAGAGVTVLRSGDMQARREHR